MLSLALSLGWVVTHNVATASFTIAHDDLLDSEVVSHPCVTSRARHHPFEVHAAQLEICEGDAFVRTSSDVQALHSCAELHGSMYITSSDLNAISAEDFPNLTKVTGDIDIGIYAGGSGAPGPAPKSITFEKLETVEGFIWLGLTTDTQDMHFPALTSLGKSDGGIPTEARLQLLQSFLVVLDMPVLRTIYGHVAIGLMNHLCTVNLRSVSRVTGRVSISYAVNTPAIYFQPLIDAAEDGVTQRMVGCCNVGAKLKAGCENFTQESYTCGC